MADPYDETVDDLTDYLRSGPESSPDAQPEVEARATDAPLDDEQSRPEEPEVAPEEPTEQVSEAEPAVDESTPGESSPSEPPAPSVNWDSDENPHLAASRQLEAIRQLAEQQRAEKEANDRKERVIKAIGGLTEVDGDDVPTLAADLYDQIAEDVTAPVLERVSTLEHGMTALAAAVNELPAEWQEFVRQTAKQNRELGQTATDIERAFDLKQKIKADQSKREQELAKELKATKAQLAALALKQQGADRSEESPAPAGTSEPRSMLEFLQGTDDEGRSLHSRYGSQRRTG